MHLEGVASNGIMHLEGESVLTPTLRLCNILWRKA